MFAPPVSAIASGVGAPPPGSRGSALTPLDGLRPPSIGRGGGSANGRPPLLGGAGAATMKGTQALSSTALMQSTTNLSEADNIKVAVRVRPMFAHEADKGGTNVVHISSPSTVKVVVPGPAGTSMQRDFAFHACLGPDVGQGDVVHLCGVPQLLDAALAGYNVTIFAYGQTGSGKTYTMSGKEDVISDDAYAGDVTHDGIVTRAITHLFSAMEAKRNDTKYVVMASYLEIYNEGIYDLLNLKAKNLPVKWDAALGFFVPGLKQVTCSKVETMMEVIRTGMKHRHVGSHELNIESSRSHSIMTIFLHATPSDPNAADFGTPRIGKISFVDLAGSERLKDSKSEGAMLKETTNINKSLFVLGKVISALAERDSAGTSAHIPYRDSKLTKLLMDSLGGNALALMIACCSPASTAVEETLSTLSYATRAKNIQNRPTVQYDPKEAQIAALRREIDLLRQENSYLREQIRVGGPFPEVSTPPMHATRPPSGPAADMPSPLGGQHVPHPSWPSLLGGGGGGPGDRGIDSGSGGGAHAPALNGSSGSLPLPAPTASAPPHLPPPTASAPPYLPPPSAGGRMTPKLGGGPGDPLRSSLSAVNGAHLEPLRVSVEVSSPSGSMVRRSSHPGPPGPPPQPPLEDIDLTRRLQDTQALLSRFSEENGRLARENDRLRANRQMLSQDHGEVLEEIEQLRSKLIQLEAGVLSGTQTPLAAKAALASAMSRADSPGSSAGGATPIRGSHSLGGAAPPSPAAALRHQGSASNLMSPHGSAQVPFGFPAPGTAGGMGGPLWTPGPMAMVATPPHAGMVAGPMGSLPMGMPLMGMGQVPHTPLGAPGSAMGQPHPHPPSSGGHLGGGYPMGGGGGGGHPVNVMTVGSGAGGRKYGGGPPPRNGGGGADDSIVVADKAKLALLLGDGPPAHTTEPSGPVMRPVPVKPAESGYASPAKAHHAALLNAYAAEQRSASNPGSPKLASPKPTASSPKRPLAGPTATW
ncbi:hypothetical protein HYH03_014112 [Edaphochlamys debaryana]|uniref:Kinesin-like protein n=1 Tax=Edaphochlamys debaryana TaxID=47281 RepID=A0A836BS99_9CHLO|nr:hypothetical protein HYH03_014112 [Edaphochlamys debaryana]|eukprot:KAG2487271.1 hypothetical protein HYH03_014112 [Edaphochlamys debaryana]